MTNTSKLKITKKDCTIVDDFEAFLIFFDKKVKLTKANGYITRKDLIALNEQMINPRIGIPETANQPDYPHVHLFYHLAFRLDLLHKVGQAAVLNQVCADEYAELTRTEKYVSLLNCFWTLVGWRTLHDNPPWNIDVLFEKMKLIPVNETIQLYKEKDIGRGLGSWGAFIDYFTYFGLWEVEVVEERKPYLKSAVLIPQTLTLTPLFRELEDALLQTWIYEDSGFMGGVSELFALFFEEDFDEDMEEEEEVASLYLLLQPLFGTGELTKLFIGQEKVLQKGRYVFKVSLDKDCWRTIQLDDMHTLLHMHELILAAFDFDDDHLYAFYMDGKPFSKNCYNSRMDFQGPFVDEVTIGELYLRVGQSFVYLFDFGDEWTFTVVLESIDDWEGNGQIERTILQSKGESPEQYC